MDRKNILLGITGGIAAYKMVHTASSLTKLGHNVNVVMTESAQKFISPITFKTITGLPVETDLFTESNKNEVKHISLADKSDITMIAPATANIIGKIANGIADDLLSTIITAVTTPVIVVPTMNVNMYNNPIVKDNLKYLQDKGYDVISPSEGMLACGYEGKGRLPEPNILVEYILKELTENDLEDKKVLVTAGPTRESIDPVRFLSNHSSGKMGYALAKRASYRGAEVKLISGPTNLDVPLNVEIENVESADDLYQSVMGCFKDFDIIIMAAAVADFTPQKTSAQKIKKRDEKSFNIKLNKTKDILKTISERKSNDQKIVGFAAESEDIKTNAESKLKEKDLDIIVANDIKNNDIFGNDQSQVIIITKNKKSSSVKASKEEIADRIFDLLK